MTDRQRPTDRLFAIARSGDGHMVNICPGPEADGTCPRASGSDLVPCAGARVIPLHGSGADGLPFSIPADAAGVACPMHWLDQ
ncbi:MAG: hypothetical protein M3R48_00820 [Candidatus Dormibacteraeota bacterium]|nr:hypothetical protein [Candidatus Dormibacteraeota bacterium]